MSLSEDFSFPIKRNLRIETDQDSHVCDSNDGQNVPTTVSPTHICHSDRYSNLSPLADSFSDRNSGSSSSSPPPPKYKTPTMSQELKFSALPTEFKKQGISSREGSSLDYSEGSIDDVCIPSSQQSRPVEKINFAALEAFVKNTKDGDLASRNYYRPAECTQSFSRHRPLVPQSILQVESSHEKAHLSSYFTRDNFSFHEKDTLINLEEGNMSDPLLSTEDNFDIDDFPHRRLSFTMDRFTFFSSTTDIKKQAPTLSTLLEEDQNFENLFDKKNGVWWLDCLDPSDSEMKALGKAFSIHPLTIEDIRLREVHEKVEIFKNYYFLCFNSFNNDKTTEEYLDPINVYLVIFNGGIISFHFTPISHTANVRRRVRQLRNFVNVSADWLCYAIIDDITDSFAPIIKELEVEIDFIEESVYLTRKPDFGPMIRRIGESRNKVNLMLRLLSRKADVIKMFAKRCTQQFSNAPHEEIVLYLGDIQDHIITMKQSLSIYEKMLSRSHANYLAQLQVESVNSNNRVTKVLGRVTLIGTVLVPLNLVTGLFGMNVKVPGQGGEDLKWFFGVIGFIVTLVIIFSVIANHWIVEAESAENQENKPKKKRRSTSHKFNPFVIHSHQSFDKRAF